MGFTNSFIIFQSSLSFGKRLFDFVQISVPSRSNAATLLEIYLFGKVGEENYYNSFVRPLLNPRIVEYGHAENKQEMYDMIGRVYHSSKGEVACLVKDECWSTGTKFFGGVETENTVFEGTNEEVINMWKSTLKL